MAAIFFDIDGTLWDFHHNIPESTKEAIKRLKENGHLTFLCSGRTKCFAADPALDAMGFDGGVFGCGTYAECHGEILLDTTLEGEVARQATADFLSGGMPTIMEGRDWLFMDQENICKDKYGEYLFDAYKDVIQPITDNEKNWAFSKYTVVIQGLPYEPLLEKYQDEMDFMVHDAHVMEVVPKGYCKAFGIAAVCEKLGIDRTDTYAFGDSNNDLDMLAWVHTGIAMGNAKDTAKEHADYVTDDLHEDGIYNACKHYGLI